VFKYIEKSKSLLLLESIKNNENKIFTKIPSNKLTLEKQWKNTIGKLERKLNTKKTLANTIKDSLQIELVDIKLQYDSLLNSFEKDYPEFYRLKNTSEVVDIPELQAYLEQQESAFLDFHFGDSLITCFIITGS
jgi:hypothetical protein